MFQLSVNETYAGGGTEEGIEEIAGLINVIMADSGISQSEFIAALIAFIAFNMTTTVLFLSSENFSYIKYIQIF